MISTVKWWTETPTRYPELVLCNLKGFWQFAAVQGDGSDAAQVGPRYATKMEALADLDRYARFYGCAGTGGAS